MAAIALFAFHNTGTAYEYDWNKLVRERNVVPVCFRDHLFSLLGGAATVVAQGLRVRQ